MTTHTRTLWAMVLAMGLAAPAAAQVAGNVDNTGYGTSSGEFLLLGAGARGAALGGSYAALATDVSALYYNPGGLAQLERPGVMLSSYGYVAETQYTWFGAAFPFSGGVRAIGLSLGTFGFSDQQVYTVDNPDGEERTYSVNQTFLALTYGQNFSDRFSAGLSLKVLRDKLGDVQADGFAVDFGTSFHAMLGERPIRAAFIIQNLGSTLHHDGAGLGVEGGVQREPPLGTPQIPQEGQPARVRASEWGLPVLFRVGVSYDVLGTAQNRLTVLGEFTQPNNTKPGAGLGLEWGLGNLGNSGFSLAARGSYTVQPDNQVDDVNFGGLATSQSDGSFTSDGLAVGGGIAYGRGTISLGFDYAYRNMGPLGGTNFLTFSFGW